MTADPKRLTFESPAELIAELHAKAKHVANCDGFGGELQLWATAGGPLLVFLAPDGEIEFFRPFGSTWARSPRNLGRILRGQDDEPDNTGADNNSVESSNTNSADRKPWEKFEDRVEHIYSVLLNLKGDKASVSRDVKLIGRDGLIHQFDVYYEFTRAGVNHRVAIECRDKSRPLDKDAVMAFRSKVFDIPGLQGLMVSAKGYQSGAKKYAKDNGIIAITLDELPGVGSLLAIRLENVTCPTKDNIGEPFWSLYEIDEDGEANGNLFGKQINGQRGALLFFSKKLCEEFLAQQSLVVQTRYRVFGLTQLNLCSFIMTADCFAGKFYLVFDVKPGDSSVGLLEIPRDTLIEDYVIGDHGLPKEPMVMRRFKSRDQRGRESKAQPPEVIHLPPPSE